MFDFCPYRGLRVFPLFRLVLTAFAELTHLAGATINLIPDLLAGFITYFGIFSLLSAKVSAIPVESFFLSMHEFRSHGYIMNISRRSLDSVDNTTVPVHANMSLISEVLPFFT